MPWVAGVLCALLPFASHALGLGKLKVHSALNQPLNAEIEFTSLADAEIKGLNIGLASRTDFIAAGVERAAFLSQIKFNVVRRADGRHVLRLTTVDPIREPFLHMLLQLDWTGGRLVREYTALIDPPYQISAKAPAVEPPRAAAPVVAPEPTPAPAPVAEPVAPPVEAARVAPMPVPAPEPAAPAAEDQPFGPTGAPTETLSADGWPMEEGEVPPVAAKPAAPKTAAKGRIGPAPSWANTASHTVSRGDTLWSIAKKIRSDSQVSVEQAALAIYNHNRDAFFDNNLNNIRSGKILRMPERDAVEALPKEKAHIAFQAQFDAWQEYKRRLASAKRTVAAAEPEAAEKPAPAMKPATETAATKKEAPATPKGQRQDELLKIVRANLEGEKGADARKATEPSKGGEREQVTLAERAATLEESLVSKQIEQKELGEKISQVRAQLKREARLIELESQALAPAPDKAAKPAEAPKAEVPKAEPLKPETPKVEAPSAAVPKPLETQKAEAPAPKPAAKKPVPPPPPAPEKGFFDVLLGDLLMPILLGVVVLASAVIGFIYMRRRRKASAEFEESILASQAVTTENMPTHEATAEAGVSAAESSILSDISQGNLANVRTDEVDPIAEAEVYLAYGRDETAEEILKDAVVKHPQRHELKLKLLEIYSVRKDVKAFETLAEELYAAVGGQGKIWEKVEEMGGKISPANPMFRGAGAKTVTASAGAATPATVAAAPTEVAPPPTAAIAPESALDFDLGTPAVTTSAKEEKSFDLDFDLGEARPASAAAKQPEAALAAKAEPAAFDLGLESFDLGTPAAPAAPAKEPSFDLDFDLGTPAAEPAKPATVTGEVKPAAPTGDDFTVDLGEPMTSESVEAALDVAATPSTGEVQQQQWDEAATKLDLARAYIDMGDADGARSILEEVIAEGSAEQKKQAQDLIAQIR